MENETATVEVITQNPQQVQGEKEKKHDLPWIIVQIWIKGVIVSFPALIIITILFGVIAVGFGYNMTALLERASTDAEFAKQFMLINQLIGIILIPISYIGIKWGCKTVTKKTHIDEADFGKIGYWVGIIPIIFSILNNDLMFGALIFGIFVTPKLVKKWLIRFSKE